MSSPSAPDGTSAQPPPAPVSASELVPRPSGPPAWHGGATAGPEVGAAPEPGDAGASRHVDGPEASQAEVSLGGQPAGRADGQTAEVADDTGMAPASGPSAEPGGGRSGEGRNRAATAALVTGAAGFTLITIIPALALGVVGLRRAVRRGRRRGRSGFARSVTGLVLALLWVAAAAYLTPHVVRAADPGCAAYKSAALTAYNRVIADFNKGAGPDTDVHDLSGAISELEQAAARGASKSASGALSLLARRLAAVRADIEANRTVPRSALMAMNRGAVRADAACGTLNF